MPFAWPVLETAAKIITPKSYNHQAPRRLGDVVGLVYIQNGNYSIFSWLTNLVYGNLTDTIFPLRTVTYALYVLFEDQL